MRIGATATHEFEISKNDLPNGAIIDQYRVIYSQNNKMIWIATNAEFSSDDKEYFEKKIESKYVKHLDETEKYTITVDLQQEHIVEFVPNKLAQVQVRVLLTDGTAHVSDIMNVKVYDGLDKGIMGPAPV